TATVVRNVVFDSIPPIVTITEPPADQFVLGTTVDVRGTVNDAHPGTVEVEGIQAAVDGNNFVATGVPAGDGPDVTLHARATDRVGNQGPPASVTVHVDRTP